MARRYVPKTYNNRRVLRTITTVIITLALSFTILFLILFFYFQSYVVEGQLRIHWLTEETPDDDAAFGYTEDILPPGEQETTNEQEP